MLLVDKKQMNANDVAKLFNVSPEQLNKIKKHSMFDLSADRKKFDMGTRKEKSGYGLNFPAFFFVRDENGNSVEIRYAKAVVPMNYDNRIVDKYEPRSVDFIGESEQKTDPDEALYFFLHPKNALSPFRQINNYAFLPDYIYDDKQAKAKASIKKLDDLTEALNHAKTVDADELIIFAKGMGLGSVDSMEDDEIRAQLGMLAQQDPQTYLKRKDKRLTEYEGRIRDAIDKGIFIIQESFGNKKWVWNAGQRKGELVVDIVNQTLPESEVLLNFMKENAQEYYSQLSNVHATLNIDGKAEAFLAGLGEEVKVKRPEIDNSFLPTNFNEAKEYLGQKKGNRSPSWASKLLKAITDGEVNANNVDDWIEENLY